MSNVSDPVADLLTRIRNANIARHEKVVVPSSKLKVEIARLLQQEGYVDGYEVNKDGQFEQLVITLKYSENRERVISGLKRISKPGRRIYAGKDALPRVLGGMGTAILSTSRGVITSRTAEREGVGGEVICFVW